ncbi:hypothetical protein BAUCODRAFT_123777 [Baudoinia panamericana UAMH 10762]|uniref:F-box domain-containing protein n=1 Tax=Baudoinia panamericana (strain UAMH 10762) TaxID=717646 RepID=M2MFA5_BAUPA|nr:uncharacterized protein BAUCODRAFT_123777 [Baudoinia panamericana UAMH 10762]EMC95321.1 hypothetical protein BAUCODRAFT_123777 [Baudoinia panamericana UAMH 10762]
MKDDDDSSATVPLLHLPPELRIAILEFVLIHDIDHFAETAQLPALLSVNHQLRNEHSPVFYATPLITIDVYYNASDSWCEVRDTTAKRVILERSLFVDLTDFWSLASARRQCQQVTFSHGGEVQKGIVTVRTNAGFRRWQWSMEL